MMVSGPIALDNHWERLCCTDPVRDSHCESGVLVGVALLHKLACGDSSCESSVVAGCHEQTDTPPARPETGQPAPQRSSAAAR